MREINSEEIYNTVKQLCKKACICPNENVSSLMRNAYKNETSDNALFMMEQLLDNMDCAFENDMPICQDTGMVLVYIQIGQQVVINGEFIGDCVNRGVRDAYNDNYFRMSVLDPLSRINTGDNTPCVIRTEIIQGEDLIITVAPKGFGSENMSSICMLKPAQGRQGILDFVLDTVKKAGANPCPPIIVGVGIGGTFDQCAWLAKKALLRDEGKPSDDSELVEMEKELLAEINRNGIGAQGMGGINTALAVQIEKYPTHIAGLPVAVNIQCNCSRHYKAVI